MLWLLCRSLVRLPLFVDLFLIVSVDRTYPPAPYDTKNAAVKNGRDLEKVGMSIRKLKRFVVTVETSAPQPCKRQESSTALDLYPESPKATFKTIHVP